MDNLPKPQAAEAGPANSRMEPTSEHRCPCPRCGVDTFHDARDDAAGAATALRCEECGHEFTVARPDIDAEH
jgi:transcription elongation factor Elf1